MAIYHLNVGHVSRSTGRSSVQSVAYITGKKLFESRRELKVSYTNRQSDIIASNTLAPDHAPDDCRDLSVWDRLESYEDEYAIKRFPNDEKSREKYLSSARPAMTIVVALPHELLAVTSLPEGHSNDRKLPYDHPAVELVEQFARERFVSRGLIVTYAIHDDEGNPHAHLQVARRSVDGEGRFAWAKDRDICTRAGIRETRSMWAELTNRMLEREGFDVRITEKSFADLGIDLEPTEHRGWMADKLKEKGVVSRIVQDNKEVFERNREHLIANPELILDEIIANNATFTQRDLLKSLQKRLGDDAKIVAQCFEQALDKAVYLGMDVSGGMRYTSTAYLKDEQAMLTLAETMVSREAGEPIALKNASLEGEQKEAAEGLLQGHQLSVLVGRAGSGKTTTLKAVANSYQKAGFTVVGTSLSALATDNLAREAGIDGYTVASLLHRWQRYEQAQSKFLSFESMLTEGMLKQKDWYRDLQSFEKNQLTHKHVLIVDEAGMLGTRQWQALLQRVNQSGARIIAVGDDHQFTPIEAGSPFPTMIQLAEASGNTKHMHTIHRQKEEWMKQASRHLAELETGDGLALYEKHDRVRQTDHDHIYKDVAEKYRTMTLEAHRDPRQANDSVHDLPPLVLASTNQQVEALNQAIRAVRLSQGEVGSDLFVINGKGFACGDVVVFNKNDRTIGVFNGTRGVVQEYGVGVAHIQTKEGLKSFKVKEYPYIQHGYAVTLHKSQGQTVNNSIVVASSHMDAKAVYVAMTRHRYDTQLFYAKEDFPSFQHLRNRLSRFEAKDMAQDYPRCGPLPQSGIHTQWSFHPGSGIHPESRDYTIRPENQEAWTRVHHYRLAVLDGAASFKQGDKEGYWQARNEQMKLGKEILKDYKNHQLYVNQANLTEDMLKITTGVKKRALSLVEEKAKVTVELYSEVAKETRKELKEKGPAFKKSRSESGSESFKEQRAERDSLARVILENVPLHRPFFKENNVQLRALQNQVAYRQRTEQKEAFQKDMGASIKADYPSWEEKRPFTPYTVSKTYQRSSQEVVNSLNDHIKDVAYHLLGEPSHKTAKEWRYGSKGSLAVVVSGARQGMYSNFETGSSGNAVQLVADELKLSRQEAFKWSANFIGLSNFVGLNHFVRSNNFIHPTDKFAEIRYGRPHKEVPPCKGWVPVKPGASAPVDLSKEPQLTYMMMGRQEVERYVYKDKDGNLIGYVVRLEDKDGNKITPMLSYGHYHEEGVPLSNEWGWKSFALEGQKRSLYGLEVLTKKPVAPVLVVEGEKTCEAARKIFPEHTVVTWSGGCGAVNKSDWSVLKDRDVTLWPDHDQPGRNAMNKIEGILKEEGASSIRQVDLPSTLPHKWDLADKLPEGVNKDTLSKLIGNDKAISQDLRQTIDHIIETSGLEFALDYNEKKAYQDIQNLYHSFKELSTQSGSSIPTDQWHLRRAVYAVYQMKEYGVHEISQEFNPEQRFRHTLVASTLFAHTGNSDVHFRAVGLVSLHDRTGIDDEKVFKETFGVNPLKSHENVKKDYPTLQGPLRDQMAVLFVEYQKEHQSHERQKELDRQMDRGFSR